ncbi:MAG: reverse transcriptase domain-containing protein [Ferruginibacter sp.]
MLQYGLVEQRIKGTPQGNQPSPLLSNIVLGELDKELEWRGHCYVMYAHDVKIFVGSKHRAEEVKANITKCITEKLKLKLNESKSRVCKGYELNFLGHGILARDEIGLGKQNEQRLKGGMRELTKRNKGITFEEMVQQLRIKLPGWLHYFRYAKMQSKLEMLDG